MDGPVDRPKDRPVNERMEEHEARENSRNDMLLTMMRKRTIMAADYWRRTFELGQEDVRYTYLDQWPEDIRAKRQQTERPALSLNALPQYIQSTLANLRQMALGVKFVQAGGIDGKTSMAQERMTKITLSQLLSGIMRKIEVRSDASTKYLRAAQHAIESGIGWLMVEVRPDPFDPFNDDIFISNIRNRWSVLADENATEPDLSDMKYCMVSELIPLGEFRARYPKYWQEGRHPLDDYGGYMSDVAGQLEWWGKQEHVRVFDYYFKEAQEKEFIELIHPETLERIVNRTDRIDKYVDDLERQGFKVKRRKKFTTELVKVVRCTRDQVLEDEVDWIGSRIPLVPVIGRQIDLLDNALYLGVVHYAIEPQIMRNSWATAATEKVAASPKNPYMIAKQQLQSVKDEWDRMNSENPDYLPYDAVDDHMGRALPPPHRDNQATMPTAELQMVTLMDIAMQQATGIYPSNLGQESNETSGVAIARRQAAGAAAQIGFGSNLAVAVRSLGEIALELMGQVYNDDRIITIIDAEGEDARYHVNHYITDEGERDPETGRMSGGTGEKFLINCLAASRYDIRVDIGPDSVTSMEEFWKTAESIFQNQPQMAPLVADLLFKAMPIPYAAVIAERCRKVLLPPQLLNERELAERPPPEPTPEQIIQELKTKEAEFNTQRAQIMASGQGKVMEHRVTEQKQRIVAADTERENKRRDQEEGEELTEADVRKIAKEEAEKIQEKIPTEVRKEVAAHERTKE